MEIKCLKCGKVFNSEKHNFEHLGEFCSEICKSQFTQPTPTKNQSGSGGGPNDISLWPLIFLFLFLAFLIWSFVYCIYKKGIIGLLLWIFTTPIIAPLIVALLPDDNNYSRERERERERAESLLVAFAEWNIAKTYT